MHLFNLVSLYSGELIEKLRVISGLLKRPDNRGQDKNEMFAGLTMLELSHSLQTPLTIVKGHLHSLKQKRGGAPEIKLIENILDDMSIKTYRLLNLTSLNRPGERINFSRIHLSQVLDEVAEQAGIVCAANGINFSSNIQAGVTAYGDAKKLEEAVNNLLSNAIKYIANERIINLKLSSVKNIEIEVADTGIGIPPECINKIFNKFYRVNPNSKILGSGLGLAISRKIVEMHNGQINVFSQPGKGSKFIISLPK